MQETWVRSLGWEDPLEKEKATYFSILAWRILKKNILFFLYYLDSFFRLIRTIYQLFIIIS